MRLRILEKRILKAKKLQELLLECIYQGFSLRDLSKILGFSPVTLSKWAKGEWLPKEGHMVEAIEKLKALVRANSSEYSSIQDLSISNVDPSFVFNAEIPKLKRLSKNTIRKLRSIVYGDVRKLNLSLSYLTFYAGTLNITNKVLLHEAGNIVKKAFNLGLIKYSNAAYVALAALKTASLKLRINVDIKPERYDLDPSKYRQVFSKLATYFLA
ncbi:MAG: hypothetical protein DRN04_19760 [Thermoprotei archaeon]|nr:MAG: hypothetical protein DRN04_19760 [Thermoprotei archaeon]